MANEHWMCQKCGTQDDTVIYIMECDAVGDTIGFPDLYLCGKCCCEYWAEAKTLADKYRGDKAKAVNSCECKCHLSYDNQSCCLCQS